MNYPVVAEETLGTVQRGWWQRRRQRADVPDLPAGAVYVFCVGGQYRQYPHGMPFDHAHADVVDATSVSMVDTHSRLVEVEQTMPSVSAADAFTLRITFTCQVVDAAEVARQGVTDVTVPLRAYLAGDTELARLGASHRVEEVNAVRGLVTSRMTAYTSIVAPRLPGMHVEYIGAEVLTPDDLRAWEQKVRDENRERELEKGRRAFERDGVLDIADLLAQGPLVADALGLARDGLSVADVADRVRHQSDQETARRHHLEDREAANAQTREAEERAMRAKLLIGLVQQMGSKDAYVDYGQILQQLLDDGRPRTEGDSAPRAVEAGESGKGGKGGTREDRPGDARHGFYTDEDELL